MSDDEFDFDDAALGELDAIESAYATGAALPPRSLVNKPGLKQRDLFGGTVVEQERAQPKAGPSRAGTGGSGGVGGAGAGAGETRAKVRLSKTWDRASFAKHGWSKRNAAAAKARAKGKNPKGKGRAYASDEEAWDEDDVLDDDDEDEDGEEFLVDTTYDPNAPTLPIKWEPDLDAAKTFVYPVQRDKPLRVYQYNIVSRALFENTLVSLPTGLGKTFIAAVVMLNFYRWYPRGKVLFLAPTRPLVTQQIKACHYIAGIPQNDCIELTGGTPAKLRSVGWLTKRVIYSTPQTVERDLAKGRLDPRDVTCIVVDEAHRASGDYSYCGVIRYMMCRNPHFRVLALTATPGSRGDAVQEVIDNLHIGRIEVRADDSLDIRQYVHKKSFDLCVLPLGTQLSALRDKWATLMKQYIQPLYAARLLWSQDAVMLSPFAVQQAYQKINGLPGGRGANGKFFPMIKTLAMMARAMEYLVVQSVTSFESVLKDIEGAGSKNLVNSGGFREVLRETSALRGRAGYVGHPKMEKLRSMCIEHFTNAQDERDEYTGERRETRVMIFCNFRAVVEEIVQCLNSQRPLIKATPFVGQASSKGTKGKSQKEQLETIRKFKRGDFNVLVATSIGEEGLDIGEIDLIICYEANKSPIRMLQRVGRTGRARDGHIIVLMAEGREEKNWDRANDAYNDVQNALTSNKIFDLYVDGERLLPDDVKPKCEQVEIKALPLELDKLTMTGRSAAERKALAEKKPKRKVDIGANAPDDAFLGFRTAGQLAAAKKEKPLPPSQVLRDRKTSALLSLEQEAHLRARWQHDSAGRPVRPQQFDTEELPFERSASGSAHRIPRHSDRHAELLAAMRLCEQLSDARPESLDPWHEKHSKAFNPKLVEVFRSEDRRGPPRAHTRLKRLPPSSPEDFFADIPLLTSLVPGSSFGPSAPTAANDTSLFRAESQQELDPLARELFSSPPRRVAAGRAVSPRRSPSPFASPARKPPSRPSSAAAKSAPETLDLSHLDSDEGGDMQVQLAKSPALPDERAPETSFSIDLDDDDLLLSDSELLAGAVVRGRSGSASPKKAPPPFAKGPPAAPRKEPAEIILSDSDEAILDPPSPPRPAAKPAQLERTVSAPAAAAPALAPARRSQSAAGGTSAFRPFVAPRPSVSQPERAGPPAPPPKPAAVTVASEEDDYSFFDFADDAELEACLADIPAEAVRGRSVALSAAPEEREDDRRAMPPPASTRKVVPAPLAAAAPKRWTGRVESSPRSSTASAPAKVAKGAFRPAGSAAPTAAPSSPVLPDSLKKQQPMRRLAVPDSSEGSSPVVAVRRAAAAPGASMEGGDVEGETPAKAQALSRLRRGRQELEEGDDEEPEEASPPPALKKKRRSKGGEEGEDGERRHKRKKKELLTHRAAARVGIFDIEAVNSEASGSEASTEGYASENSIDREFVARSSASPERDDPDASLVSSGQQAQFYRDSLATQAPAAFGTPQFARGGLARWQDRLGAGGGRKPIPVTPASQGSEREDWSYDSFCVADDEEIEYEMSSPARR
ncbi:3'-5' DNA helicase [Rhodotorula kratochvilovae]